tara:strand:+ start:1629 stop:2381 length:753 start_codon:yes stop_codon:yes gene_type:complete
MASTYNYLGIELMATGENAGTWGTKTNTNLNIIQQAASGYHSQSIAGGAGTSALLITDGDDTSATDSLTNAARNAIIELTGTITGNRIVTIPNGTEKFYLIKNSTSGSFTVQVKGASDSGAGTTFAATAKDTKLIYINGQDVTNVELGSGGTSWQAKKTSSFAAVAGEGYFVDTATGSAAITATLPGSAAIGDTISFIDYAGNFGTHKLEIGRNGHNISGAASNLDVQTNNAGLQLVYVDSTKGWLIQTK